MNFSVRNRPFLRRAAFVAALGALMVPASAGASVHAQAAAKKTKLPVVTSVRPMSLNIGDTLEIKGKYFLRGRYKNSVVFKRDGGRAVFVKAKVGTTKLLRVTVPKKLEREFAKGSNGVKVATRFRVRVLTKKLGKRFTTLKKSPVVGFKPGTAPPPPPPPAVTSNEGDCDRDGVVNRVDGDDDNDLLSDGIEAGINAVLVGKYGPGIAQMNPCSADTDGDGVEDGYEYKSAKDLNDDEYEQPNTFLPYPGKKPYANPLAKDAGTDYDGDSLSLDEEFRLWKKFGARTLEPLYYSDGEQYSVFRRIASGPHAGRREPALAAAGYVKQAEFVNWANASGNRRVFLQDGYPWYEHATIRNEYGLFDVNRDGSESADERNYFDRDGDTWLSDEERDEDADGLINYDESGGRLFPTWWGTCYTL
jgi:hypothetical protein